MFKENNFQFLILENAKRLTELHNRVRSSIKLLHTSPRAREEWFKACEEFHNQYDNLAFPGGLMNGLNRIQSGDLEAIEIAILYLELRPFFYRAQFNRNVFIRLLKRQKLPFRLQQRFDATQERIRAWRDANRDMKRLRSDQLYSKISISL